MEKKWEDVMTALWTLRGVWEKVSYLLYVQASFVTAYKESQFTLDFAWV